MLNNIHLLTRICIARCTPSWPYGAWRAKLRSYYEDIFSIVLTTLYQRFVALVVWTPLRRVSNIGTCLCSTDRLICHEFRRAFFSLISRSDLHSSERAIGAVGVFEINNLVYSLEATASVSSNSVCEPPLVLPWRLYVTCLRIRAQQRYAGLLDSHI